MISKNSTDYYPGVVITAIPLILLNHRIPHPPPTLSLYALSPYSIMSLTLSPVVKSLIQGIALTLQAEGPIRPEMLALVTAELHMACSGSVASIAAPPKKSKKKKSRKPRATSALQMYLKMEDDGIRAELQEKFDDDETTIAGKSGDIPIYKVLKKTQELSTKMNYMAVSSHGGKMYAALSEEEKQTYIDAAEAATNAARAAVSDDWGSSDEDAKSSKKKKSKSKKKSKKKKSKKKSSDDSDSDAAPSVNEWDTDDDENGETSV